MRGLFRLYERALRRRPYLVQALQTGTLMGAGDLIAQKFVENKSLQDISIKRTLQFSSIGFFVGGPALRFWYGILNNHIGTGGKIVVLKKVLIDQLIFAPTFLAILLGTVAAMQGKNIQMIKEEMKSNYVDVLVTNYYVWPWVQIVNFYFVPLQYQVLLVQVVAVFWNTYISWKTNKTVGNYKPTEGYYNN